MEYYRFRLSPADRKAAINFEEIERNTNLFSVAADNCNQGLSFRQSGKEIEIEEIAPRSITLTLASAAPLANPVRSLSAFSRELLRLDREAGALRGCIYNHTLFSSQALKGLPQNRLSEITISDSELMKAMIDLLFSNAPAYKKDMKKRNAAIAEIKNILLPYIIAAAESGRPPVRAE